MSAARDWLVIGGLALGPAVTNGFARFAYGQILPAMRDDLGWSYAEAGWLNTANAIGYLLGALLALALIGRVGARRLFIFGMALTTASLIASALTRDLWALSAWRIAAGVGGAPVFIAGGAMASTLFANDKAKNALAIAVYFGGGGLGMVATGAPVPFFLETAGGAYWPMVWLGLGAASALAFLPSALAALATRPPKPTDAGGVKPRLPVLAMAPALAAYFCFGLGYVVYLTFFIAWMREGGEREALEAAAWTVMGVAVMASPFIWKRALARAEGGGAIALTSLATGSGIVLALIWPTAEGIMASTLLFGASFFMVPTSTTTFGRKNLPEALWGPSLALFTTIFSLGQIIGPVAGGAISDWSGGTTEGIAAGGAILFLGAGLGAMQRALGRRS